MDDRLARMLAPRAIALVGATERPGYAARLLGNLERGPYAGEIVPVSRTRTSVSGRPAYRSLADVPVPVDIAIVAVPAPGVAEVVADCGRLGVPAALVISAGFAEAGEQGKALQDEVVAAARAGGVLLVGPNCNGYSSASSGIWASSFSLLSPETVRPAIPAVLLSQSGSGAFGGVHARAQDLGFSFEAVVTTGNEAAVSTARLARAFLDTGARVVAMLSEQIRDGEELLAAAAVARETGKHLVICKIGRSEVGQQATATHTGALAGDDTVIDHVLRQHGIVRVDDYDELVEATYFLCRNGALPGRRALVVSHSGGLNSIIADGLGSAGFTLAELSDGGRHRLLDGLAGRGHVGNPVDITTTIRQPAFADHLAVLFDEDGVDLLCVASAGGDDVMVQRLLDAWHASARRVALCFVWYGALAPCAGLDALRSSGIAWFSTARNAGAVLGRILAATVARTGGAAGSPGDGIAVDTPLDAFDEARGKDLLAEHGVAVPGGVVVATAGELGTAALPAGPPWVAKLVAPGLLHKTEIGGVRLGIADRDALRAAVDDLLAVAARDGLEEARCLVETQVDGLVELFVGRTWNATFGAVVCVGRGGLDVEVGARVAWATCPVSDGDVDALVDGAGLGPLLAGFRGTAPARRDSLRALVRTVSRLRDADGGPRVEVDVNPVVLDRLTGDAVAVDVVVQAAADGGG